MEALKTFPREERGGGEIMPFRSVKQRKYMWARHPEIAKRWTKKYGSKIVKKKKTKRKKRKTARKRKRS